MKKLIAITIIIFTAFVLTGCKPPSRLDMELRGTKPSEDPSIKSILIPGEPIGKSLDKVHIMTQSPCPDPFDPIVITGKSFETWKLEGADKWHNAPKRGEVNAPFTINFNCNVDGPGVYKEFITLSFHDPVNPDDPDFSYAEGYRTVFEIETVVKAP